MSSDASQAMVNRVSGFLDYWAKYAPTKWEITKDIALNGGDVEKAESDAAKLLKKNENIKEFMDVIIHLQWGLQRHLQNKNERILLWSDLIWQRRQNSLLKTRIIEEFP